MIKRLALISSVIFSILLVSSPVLAAQSDPDIDDVADLVLDTDLDDLIDGLQETPRNRDLPDGFSDPVFVDLTDADAVADEDVCVMYDASTEEYEGVAGFSLTGNPDSLDYPYACASFNYLVYDQDATSEDILEDAVDINSPDFENPPDDVEAQLDELELDGHDAILMTIVTESDGVQIYAQTLGIPVGNVMVYGVVTLGDEREIDSDDAAELVASVTTAAIAYLGSVAEDAQ